MKTILIIEDDAQTVDLYRQTLESPDISIIHAGTAVDGFNILSKNKPDLVILDIMLPGGSNGFDLLEQIKREEDTKSVPVLVLTNLDSEKNTTLAMGAADYIVKTQTSLQEIKDKVFKLLGKSSQ